MKEQNTAGWRFYNKQIEYLLKRDINGLIENNYNKDAVLLSFDFTIKGEEALKKHFEKYLDMLGGLELKSTDKFTETENSLFFEATIITGKYGEVHVYDAFVLRDGKTSHHFTGVK